MTTTNKMKAAGWSIWCGDIKDFHRLGNAVRLFRDEMSAKAYLDQKVPSRVACDRVVQVEIRVTQKKRRRL